MTLPVLGKRPYPFESSSINDSPSSPFASLPQDVLNKLLDLLTKQDWLTMTTLSKATASLLEFKWRQYSVKKRMDFNWFGLDVHPYPQKMRCIYGRHLQQYVTNEIPAYLITYKYVDNVAIRIGGPKPHIFLEGERFLNHPQAGNQLFTGLKNLLDTHAYYSSLTKNSAVLQLIESQKICQSYQQAFQALENAIEGRAIYASVFTIQIVAHSFFSNTYFNLFIDRLLYLAEKSAQYGDIEGLERLLNPPFLDFIIRKTPFKLDYLPNLLYAITHAETTKEVKENWIVALAKNPHLKRISSLSCYPLLDAVIIAISLEKWEEANCFLDNLFIPIHKYFINLRDLEKEELLEFKTRYENTNLANDKIINSYKNNLPARACYLSALLKIEQIVTAIYKSHGEELGLLVSEAKKIIHLLETAIAAFGDAVPAEVWVHKAIIHYLIVFYIGDEEAISIHAPSAIRCIDQGISSYGEKSPEWAWDILRRILKEIYRYKGLRNSPLIKEMKIKIPYTLYMKAINEIDWSWMDGSQAKCVRHFINKIVQMADIPSSIYKKCLDYCPYYFGEKEEDLDLINILIAKGMEAYQTENQDIPADFWYKAAHGKITWLTEHHQLCLETEQIALFEEITALVEKAEKADQQNSQTTPSDLSFPEKLISLKKEMSSIFENQ